MPAAMRCSPGSRSSPMSPMRNGSGRASRSLAAVPERPDVDRHRGGADVQHQLAVQLAGRPQRDVDLGGVQPRARSPDGVAAADVLTVDAAQVHRDARHRADLGLVAFAATAARGR